MIEIEHSDIIELIKECGYITRGDFTLSSGKKSNYYVNVKEMYTNPVILRTLTERISTNILNLARRGIRITKIAGVELGGIPLATAVSLDTGIPLLIVRQDIKNYGIKNRFIGRIDPEDNIIIIEDVTTSGNSAKDVIQFIRSQNETVKVNYVVSIVDREDGAYENLKAIKVQLAPLVRISELDNFFNV